MNLRIWKFWPRDLFYKTEGPIYSRVYTVYGVIIYGEKVFKLYLYNPKQQQQANWTAKYETCLINQLARIATTNDCLLSPK